jgi:hypothetical protein
MNENELKLCDLMNSSLDFGVCYDLQDYIQSKNPDYKHQDFADGLTLNFKFMDNSDEGAKKDCRLRTIVRDFAERQEILKKYVKPPETSKQRVG